MKRNEWFPLLAAALLIFAVYFIGLNTEPGFLSRMLSVAGSISIGVRPGRGASQSHSSSAIAAINRGGTIIGGYPQHGVNMLTDWERALLREYNG